MRNAEHEQVKETTVSADFQIRRPNIKNGKEKMGVAGFEPATSPASAVCSPGLNYTPVENAFGWNAQDLFKRLSMFYRELSWRI